MRIDPNCKGCGSRDCKIVAASYNPLILVRDCQSCGGWQVIESEGPAVSEGRPPELEPHEAMGF